MLLKTHRIVATTLAVIVRYGVAILADDILRAIPSAGHDIDIDTGKLLAPILTPRVPDTEGSRRVQKHFVDFFSAELPSWEIKSQSSTSKTPATEDRDVLFTNWIFRRDPPWANTEGDVARLTLAAHFDTLRKPEGFVGAVDSAMSCAILLHVASSIDEALTTKWTNMEKSGRSTDERGIQIIFLDGEETFEEWSATDSLYGARSLAEQWASDFNGATSTYRSTLQTIDIFVLLDLLGAASPSIPSYYLPTHWAYQQMAHVEQRMRNLSILESTPKRPFLPDLMKEGSEFDDFDIPDDHLPFMQRGVDVLHLIPNFYPAVWHTMDDDGEHLDMRTSRDWSRIITAFVMEYLKLDSL